MRILVTGGAGFIGSALCRRLIQTTDAQVLNLDLLTYAGRLESLADIAHDPRYRFVKGDVRDTALLTDLIPAFAPDAVIHLAAETHVDRSIDNSLAFMTTNIIGTHTLLQASLSYWRSLSGSAHDRFRFLHVSTDEVFGSLGAEGAFSEATPYDPRSPYSASKASSDHLVRAWRHTFGLPTIVSNCSNNYGPHQFPEKLIPLMILKAAAGEPLPVYGDGLNIRDWLYVEDHAEALIQIAQRGKPGETYCVGGRSERTNLAVVREIIAAVDRLQPDPSGYSRERLISFVPDRPGHDRRYAIDSSRIERDLGWRQTVTFEEGLARTVDWYLRREDWWRPIWERVYAGARLGAAGPGR